MDNQEIDIEKIRRELESKGYKWITYNNHVIFQHNGSLYILPREKFFYYKQYLENIYNQRYEDKKEVEKIVYNNLMIYAEPLKQKKKKTFDVRYSSAFVVAWVERDGEEGEEEEEY